jgi:predicted lipoprotein
MKIASTRRACAFSIAFALLALSGCKIMPIEEDRALRERRSDNFDAERFVSSQWEVAILPELEQRAIPFSQLNEAAAANLETAGRKFGRQAGDGSPWAFVTTGSGTVTAINQESIEGTIEILVPTGAGAIKVLVQTGPVIVDNSIRDALPFLTFNDFSGQIAFAEVGRALTSRALAETGAVLRELEVGDRVGFLGTFSLADGADQPRLTAVRLSMAGQG